MFSTFNEELFKEITQLLTLENFRYDNFFSIVVVLSCLVFVLFLQYFSLFDWLSIFRDNEQLSKYGDTKSARGIMLAELKKLIEANPLFRDKLQFPTLKNSRLRTLINQRFLEIHFLRYFCSCF